MIFVPAKGVAYALPPLRRPVGRPCVSLGSPAFVCEGVPPHRGVLYLTTPRVNGSVRISFGRGPSFCESDHG